MLNWSVCNNNVYYRTYLHLEDVNMFYYYLSNYIFKLCDFLDISLFHRFVCIPVSNLYFNSCKTIAIIHLPYFTSINLFKDYLVENDEYIDEDTGEYEFKDDRDKSIKLGEEFDLIYKKLEDHNNGR
jgi:hypothetical protein